MYRVVDFTLNHKYTTLLERREQGKELHPPSGGGFTRNDVPVYPGASQVAKGSWMTRPEEGESHKVEWRHYETSNSASTVFAFYQFTMPQNGWQKMMEMEVEELSWLIYTKNNEKDVAWVYVSGEDDKTLIHLMRGSE